MKPFRYFRASLFLSAVLVVGVGPLSAQTLRIYQIELRPR